jgi:hypothetical protein
MLHKFRGGERERGRKGKREEEEDISSEFQKYSSGVKCACL